jgi:hypothetical protein
MTETVIRTTEFRAHSKQEAHLIFDHPAVQSSQDPEAGGFADSFTQHQTPSSSAKRKKTHAMSLRSRTFFTAFTTGNHRDYTPAVLVSMGDADFYAHFGDLEGQVSLIIFVSD